MITRFSVLPDERGLILGVDKSGVFEPGKVYEAVKILDQIVIREVGNFSLAKSGSEYPNCNSEMDAIAYSGLHLITEDERKGL